MNQFADSRGVGGFFFVFWLNGNNFFVFADTAKLYVHNAEGLESESGQNVH